MKRQRINNLLGKLNDDDRRDLCCLLLKAGYTARIGKETVGSKGKIAYFIEYWEEEDDE